MPFFASYVISIFVIHSRRWRYIHVHPSDQRKIDSFNGRNILTTYAASSQPSVSQMHIAYSINSASLITAEINFTIISCMEVARDSLVRFEVSSSFLPTFCCIYSLASCGLSYHIDSILHQIV